MLVQNSVYRNLYLTDGVNKEFYFSFPILESSQVLVQTSLLTDTNTVTTIDPSQYTVTGVGLTTGGHISFTTAPPTGSRIALTLNIPITQLYQYAELDSFPAKSHEDALAKLTLICQQLQAQLERAVVLPFTSSESPETVIANVYASRDAAVVSASTADEARQAVAIGLNRASSEADRAQSEADRAQMEANRAQNLANVGPASSDNLGFVKIGEGIAVTEGGIISVPAIPSPWDIFPPYVPIPVWGVAFGGSDGRRAIMPGETEPREDWIRCDGGSDGNGGSVPDMTGRVILGANASYIAGTKGGTATHEHTISGYVGNTTLSIDQLAAHAHTTSRGNGTGDNRPYYQGSGTYQGEISTYGTGSSWGHSHTVNFNTAAASNMQPFCAMHYIIKV